MTTRCWSKFHPWRNDESKWIENSEYVEEDLKYLLGLEVDEFWSTVNDFHCNELLDSCLTGFPRSQDELILYSKQAKSILDKLYRRVFLVFLRLSTHKEKPFKSTDEFGKVIYNNYLISVPQIFDLCNLFSQGNSSLIKDMMENIFKHQPKYLSNDLPIAVGLMYKYIGNDVDVANLLDIFKTVYNFLCVFPKGAKVFYERGFHLKASEIYSQSLHKNSTQTAKKARHFLINSVHLIIEINLLRGASPSSSMDSNNKSTSELFHEYQDLLLHFVSEENFIVDYDTRFPVSEDLKLLQSMDPNLDIQAIEYILSGVSLGRDNLTKRIIMKSEIDHAKRSVNSTVLTVKETLPELGEGFILKCLEYYEDDPMKVVNALFEENLPPHLNEMDRSLELAPTPAPASAQPKRKTKMNAILDDHSFMDNANMKSFYEIRGLVSDSTLNGGEEGSENGDEYDDDYDDTYDDQDFGLREPDAHEERRAFVLPRALGGGHIGKTIYEKESEEEDENENSGTKPFDFCRNPQEVREERERKRLTKTGGKARVRDVVGNARGQGQDKSVLLNRARKTANKNKGQRIGADRKMSKGMF
ncbi:activating signal cointegrator 1 complex subunit 2 [Lepeophtheirus salmonis]|uniref:activating signal cointegrator 1 complex subunit 2 n=1 Tax=Lepeophtheirus salmonis TaxID=72036 RepID=UPI001AE16669|nr:activating signal cointegrator 1 complex subunit 2-like [Lepeophtheirus salmonis]XP_040573940.1 activating signal cointegrator 1 complex subunit 2-like [Lepeophtheirus salmonis]